MSKVTFRWNTQYILSIIEFCKCSQAHRYPKHGFIFSARLIVNDYDSDGMR